MGYHHESSLVLSSKCCNWAYHDMFLSKSRINSPEWFTHVSAILRHCKTESTETASFFSGQQRCAQDYTYYNFTPQLSHTQTVWWLQRYVLFHCCMGSWFPTNYLGLVALILRQISVSWNHHTVSYRFGLEKPRLRAGKSWLNPRVLLDMFNISSGPTSILWNGMPHPGAPDVPPQRRRFQLKFLRRIFLLWIRTYSRLRGDNWGTRTINPHGVPNAMKINT